MFLLMFFLNIGCKHVFYVFNSHIDVFTTMIQLNLFVIKKFHPVYARPSKSISGI